MSSRRTRNVLAYLLTHRETPVPRDVLMDVFWGNADPEAARNSVHVALSGVRRALRATGPEPLLERRHDTYRFADHLDVWVDVEAFEQASRQGRRAEEAGDAAAALDAYERAGQLYDGDFLADDPYSPWAGEIRETLRAQANDVACRQVALYGRLGDDSSVVLVGRRVLAGDRARAVHRQRWPLRPVRAAAPGAAAVPAVPEALWTTFRIQPAIETTVLYESLRGRLPQAAPGNARDRGHLPRPALHAEPSRSRLRGEQGCGRLLVVDRGTGR